MFFTNFWLNWRNILACSARGSARARQIFISSCARDHLDDFCTKNEKKFYEIRFYNFKSVDPPYMAYMEGQICSDPTLKPGRKMSPEIEGPIGRNVLFWKVVLHCASEMKEFMKMTSETLIAIRTWYEAENGSNGSYNFVFNPGPQVCSGLWLRKHAVKVRIFTESEIDKSVFTGWKRVFTRWKWTYLFQIDKAVFTRWKWTYLFQTWEKFGTSRSVSDTMWVSLQVRKNS